MRKFTCESQQFTVLRVYRGFECLRHDEKPTSQQGYPAANVLLLSEVSRREMQEVWSGAASDRPILSFQQDVPQMWHG